MGICGQGFGVSSLLRIYFISDAGFRNLFFINNDRILSQHFEHYEYVDNAKLITLIYESSLLLLLLNNTKIQNTTPYKLFDYLVSKKDIITLCDHKNLDVASFLEYYKKNDIVSYSNKKKIEKQILDSFTNFILDKKVENKIDIFNEIDNIVKK